MYNHQTGCIAKTLSSIAMIALLFLSMKTLFSTYMTWVEMRDILSIKDLTLEVVLVLVSHLIILIIFLPAILILGGMFPAMRVEKSGLKYRYLGFLGGNIQWDEIDEIINLKRPQNAKAIVISRRGFFLFNGLWLNTVLGLIFTGQPVQILILTKEMSKREHLLEEIRSYNH